MRGRARSRAGAALLASMAYGWDPAWLKAMRDRPGTVLTLGGKPVMAHVPTTGTPRRLRRRSRSARRSRATKRWPRRPPSSANTALRKRERPFVLPLDPSDPEPVERAAYDAAYKGVTDALTLYLWRKPAFYLTRWAARAGLVAQLHHADRRDPVRPRLRPVLARRIIGSGMLSGFIFMVLDTVDGKLARCTGASSKWGNVFDHGIDLVHPPFWWWAWEHGLAAYGRPLEPVYATMVLWVIIGGYVAQRVDRGPVDPALRRHGNPRLAAARQQVPADHRAAQSEHGDPRRRACCSGGPTAGLVLVAWWTLISLIFHAVRLAQMTERQARGAKVTSWLDA